MEQEGLSPYHFCANDPANYTDPTGLGNETGNGEGGSINGEGQKTMSTMGTGTSGSGSVDLSGEELMSIALSFMSYTTPSVPTFVATGPSEDQGSASATSNTTTSGGTSETTQDIACMVPSSSAAPQVTPPTPGDQAATSTGTFGTAILNSVSAAASEVGSAVSSIVNYRPPGFAGVVQDKMNSVLIPANRMLNPFANLSNGIYGLSTGRDIQTGEATTWQAASADIGFALMPGIGGELSGASEVTTTTVYRAIDAVEGDIIKNTGQFSLQTGGLEVKYFAQSIEDANWYGQRLYPNGYSIITGTVTGPITQFWHPYIDIGAYVFPQEMLPNITPH